MTDRRAVGRKSRTKGKVFERKIATMLRDAGIDCRRGWQARSGADACDIEGTTWWIECGTGRALDPLAKLLQAEKAAHALGDTRPCVAVCRRFGSPHITATMRLHSACIDCETEDDSDVVTMPVEDWIKRVVRDLRSWQERIGKHDITVADIPASDPMPCVRCAVEITKAQAGRAAS